MKTTSFHHAALAGALLLALSGTTAAQSGAPTPAERKELEAARSELRQAAERVAELSRKYRDSAGAWRGMGRKPVLGVLLSPDPRSGVRIAGVTPDSAAADAGLRSGDRLLGIDGKPILGSDGNLRIENARKLLGKLDTGTPVALAYERGGRKADVKVTPRLGNRALVYAGDGFAAGDFDFDIDIDHDAIRASVDEAMREVSKEMPRIRQEIVRLGDCGKDGKRGKDGENTLCRFPALAEAFRWSGLNLAAVSPQLGRYFGTDQGVLVLSAGDELAGLQPGDVVQKIDGKSVATPRQAMAVLRSKPADSRVRVDYLRDRKPATAQIKVPEATPFRIPAPPAPPAPPRAPAPPKAALPVPPPDAAALPRPPAPPAAPKPAAAPRISGRPRHVFVDDDGNATVLTGGDAPLPPTPPPAPPAPFAD